MAAVPKVTIAVIRLLFVLTPVGNFVAEESRRGKKHE